MKDDVTFLVLQEWELDAEENCESYIKDRLLL